jgi:hypothetical protein
MYFTTTLDYLNKLDLQSDKVDDLDKMAYALINNEWKYEKASQALRRRFSRGCCRQRRTSDICEKSRICKRQIPLLGTRC